MATSPYQTYQDIYEAVINDAKESTAITAVVDLVKRYINEGYEAINQRQRRPYLDKKYALTMNAKQTVTCTVTQDSTTVTLSSAVALTSSANNFFGFHVQGDQEYFEISSISSLTVTLAASYKGESNTAASAIIYHRGCHLDADIREVYEAYHDIYRFPMDNVGVNKLRETILYNPDRYDYPAQWALSGPDSSGAGKKHLYFYPWPNDLHTLYIDTNIFATELSAASDEPVLPMSYRASLYWYALSKLFGYNRNYDKSTEAMGMFQEWLKRIDGDSNISQDNARMQIDYRRPRRFTKGFGFDSRMRDPEST